MTPNQASDLFEMHRPRLVRLGYRMLGGRAAAEDIVQDAWLRWSNIDQFAVSNVAPSSPASSPGSASMK